MPTATSAPVTMQQAFEKAMEEHSKPAEPAPPTQESTAEPEPDTTSTQDTDPAAGASPDTASTESTDLISDTDWKTIQTQFPNDPTKQRAELNKRWTQKTQALAAEKKAAERLNAYADLVDAFEADPEETIATLAKQHGLQITKPTEDKATQTATDIADAAVAQVKQHLGPDLDFLAEPLTRAMHGVAEAVAKAVAEQTVAPVKQQLQATTEKAAQEQLTTVFQTFEQKHPSWKTHEPEMLKLSKELKPSPEMAPLDYLERLYRLATFDEQIAKAGAKAVTKLAKAAEGAEKDTQSVSAGQVTPSAPKDATIQDAYQAAKRGERWSR